MTGPVSGAEGSADPDARRAYDAELVRRYLAARSLPERKEVAGAILDAHGGELLAYCENTIGSEADAADVCQEVLSRAWLSLDQLRNPESLRSWLFGIARHRVREFLRSPTRTRFRPSGDLPETADDAGPDVDWDIRRRQFEQQNVRLLYAAIESLPPSQRRPIAAFLKYQQRSPGGRGQGAFLARELAVGEVQARRLLSEARASLHQALGAQIVATWNRAACMPLDRLLAAHEWISGPFEPLLFRRLNRHIEDCDICFEYRRRRAVSDFAYPVLVPAMLAPEFRQRVLDTVPEPVKDQGGRRETQAAAAGLALRGEHSRPSHRHKRKRRPTPYLLMIVAVLLLIGGPVLAVRVLRNYPSQQGGSSVSAGLGAADIAGTWRLTWTKALGGTGSPPFSASIWSFTKNCQRSCEYPLTVVSVGRRRVTRSFAGFPPQPTTELRVSDTRLQENVHVTLRPTGAGYSGSGSYASNCTNNLSNLQDPSYRATSRIKVDVRVLTRSGASLASKLQISVADTQSDFGPGAIAIGCRPSTSVEQADAVRG